MPGRISDEKRQEILKATRIVDLIGERVALRPAGREFKGLCPFHDEKTPSFSVNPEKGYYHCHGCQAGGDAIRFLMETDRLSFREAVEVLARRAGIDVETEDPEAARRSARLARLHDALAWAAGVYHGALASPGAAGAREYLARRRFRRETLETFGIGWAPAGWEFLVEAARKSGRDPELLVEAGLASPRDSGRGHYDFFRERILFPIRDESGRVVAFGGRVLGTGERKYINTRHTPVYDKSRILYGLDLARGAAKDGLLVVEGYTDVMGLHQAGIGNAVASLGTAFTPHQADLVGRYVRQAPITLLFDSDAAGERAAERGVENFLERDLTVRIATLPGERDPDEFVADEGADALRALVRSAAEFLDFKLSLARSRYDLGAIAGRAAAVDFLLATIQRTPNPVRRKFALQRTAEVFGLAVEELQARLEQLQHRGGSPARPGAPAPLSRLRAPGPESPPWVRKGEEFVVQALLCSPLLADEVRRDYPPEKFRSSELASAANRILSLGDPSHLAGLGREEILALATQGMDGETASLIRAIQARHASDEVDYRKELETFLKKLRKEENDRRRQEERERLREAERAGDREGREKSLRSLLEHKP